MVKPRTAVPTPKRREASSPKRSAKVAPKSTARVRANPSAGEKLSSAHAPDRRSNTFALTADQQRRKAAMGAREAALFERHERYWRAREIIGEAVEEMLTASKVTSKSARRTTKDRVKELLDALLKEYGDVPMWLPPKKSV